MTTVVRSAGGGRPSKLTVATVRALPRTVALAVRLLWRANRRTFAAAAALQAIAGGGIAIQLLVGRNLLEHVLRAGDSGRDRDDVVVWLGALVAVTIVVNLAATAAQFLQRLLTEQTIKQVQGQTLDAAGAVDLATFESASFFDQLQRASSQGVMAPLQISMNLLGLIANGIGLVGIAVALIAIAPLLVPLLVIGYLPLWYAATANSAAIVEFSFGQTANDRARQALQRILTGRASAAEVRAFALTPLLRRRWDALFDERIDEARRVASARLSRSAIANVASSILTAAVYLLLLWFLVEGRLNVAGAATAALAVQQLGSKLTGLTVGMGSIYESSQFLDETLTFFDQSFAEAARTSRSGAVAPAAFGELQVDNVTFSYAGTEREALRGVSLDVRAGEIIALVGENGSGKTTLAKVLAGLYAPSSGVVRWDGVDLHDVDPASVRERVAVTFQDFVRYPLSGWENVGVGRVDELDDHDRVRRAADHAGASSILDGLPAGFDTLLSKEFEGGEDLSSGQWQRIALARAFFRDAPFIILDEPTAALDPRAEYELFKAIRELFHGRTVLLISHRFSSVRGADRIFVLDEGRITERGTHDELMAAGGTYAELFTMQAAAYLDRGEDDRPAAGQDGAAPLAGSEIGRPVRRVLR